MRFMPTCLQIVPPWNDTDYLCHPPATLAAAQVMLTVIDSASSAVEAILL